MRLGQQASTSSDQILLKSYILHKCELQMFHEIQDAQV